MAEGRRRTRQHHAGSVAGFALGPVYEVSRAPLITRLPGRSEVGDRSQLELTEKPFKLDRPVLRVRGGSRAVAPVKGVTVESRPSTTSCRN
jgi:hypothetical protein